MDSMDFVAIDFETANTSPDSPCQLGAVVVQGGSIVAEHSWMLRPKRMFFSERCVAVHGIRPRDVLCEPEWDVVWPNIWRVLDGQVLVAHNASFDMRVLSATLATYDLDCPAIEYSCTRLIARRTWAGRRSYGLKPTATALGLTFQHHDGLEDARVCARIALASAAEKGVGNWPELESELSITRGAIRFGELRGPRTKRRSKSAVGLDDGERRREFTVRPGAKRPSMSVEQIMEIVGPSQPLKNRNVVLCGRLLDFDDSDSQDLLRALGANVQPKINMMTHYLLVGKSGLGDSSELAAFDIRQNEAKRRSEEGQPIQIMTHRQWIKFLPNGMDLVRVVTGG
jgi:DNA polymerase-3 subunit epsilon